MKLFHKGYIFLQALWFIIRLILRPFHKQKKPVVYAKLVDPRCGKYMFSLLAFLLYNYNVHLFADLRFLSSLLPYSELLLKFPALKISFQAPKKYDLYISTCQKKKSNNSKHLQISYEYFGAKHEDIVMPYPMSPQHYAPFLTETLEKLRINRRQIGVFFSGNQKRDLYTNSIISTKFKKVNRIQLLNYLTKNIPCEHIEVMTGGFGINDDFIKKFVLLKWKWSQDLFENKKARISDARWLKQLSNCNFFLACPGMIMPMCHNIIEAMAVGAIPITQYPEEFYPSLTPGVNCLAFKNEQEAKDQILHAIHMSQHLIQSMRSEVIQYYDKHLSPTAFFHRIEAGSNTASRIIINAEQLTV